MAVYQVQACKLDEMLECSICCDSFKNPVALPCLHVFCNEPCLQDWIKKGHRTCPNCRAAFTPGSEKPFHFLKNFIDGVKPTTGLPCDDCKILSTLQDCVHCSKKICPTCSDNHLKLLKEEVSRLCDVMNTETGPILETLGEKIASLMSKLSTTKQELSKKLQDAHDLLVSQIHDLRERSIQILDKVEQNSLSDIDAQITEIDTLLARIDSICEKSENIEKEQDIGELVKLDTEMTKLQKDIESVQLKVANSKLDNLALNSDKITLENLKINQAYKNIVAQIEETEMLRTVTSR
uniref:RING finger protein nhl-1 n=2 Tax=Schistocephalus solidus TaxID=70667 RepID=A0A0X3P7J8_SCHSO